MRLLTIQLLGLIGVQTVLGYPGLAAREPYAIAKRAGPGPEEELYFEEITVGAQIGQGADATVSKANVRSTEGWDSAKTWAFKYDYRNINFVQKELKAYKAIHGHGIGPELGAKVVDMETLVDVGILVDYVETRETDSKSKSDARVAMRALKALHGLGWVHGDIHMVENILIRKSDSQALLIDFVDASQTTDAGAVRNDLESLKRVFSGVEWDGDEVKE
ncbi:alpha-galactosidase a precursor [Seiridium cupressi]